MARSARVRDRIRELRRVPASSLRPSPRNWRRHPPAQRAALRGILEQIGFADAVLARETPDGLMLIDGHLRAEEMGAALVPVLVLDVDEAEADLMLATLDPLAAMAQPDQDKLLDLLASVETESQAVKDMLEALANGETQPLPDEVAVDVEPRLNEAEELREKWGVERGQVWTLGEHRVMCGDSGVIEHIEMLVRTAQATVVFTDPPYGVSIGAKNRFLNSFQPAGRNLADLASDDSSERDLYAMLLSVFDKTCRLVMAGDCSIFVCAPQGGSLGLMMMMMREAGLPVRHVLIWRKNQPTFSLGRLDYEYQHEPILFTWKATHKRVGDGLFTTSVWDVDKPRANREHPTMKPLELPLNAIARHSDPGDVVYDPFLGSGTTLIAAERLGRVCYGMEISPAYVAVALQRWADATGKTPRLA
jgi:DNA modification methylase